MSNDSHTHAAAPVGAPVLSEELGLFPMRARWDRQALHRHMATLPADARLRLSLAALLATGVLVACLLYTSDAADD